MDLGTRLVKISFILFFSPALITKCPASKWLQEVEQLEPTLRDVQRRGSHQRTRQNNLI